MSVRLVWVSQHKYHNKSRPKKRQICYSCTSNSSYFLLFTMNYLGVCICYILQCISRNQPKQTIILEVIKPTLAYHTSAVWQKRNPISPVPCFRKETSSSSLAFTAPLVQRRECVNRRCRHVVVTGNDLICLDNTSKDCHVHNNLTL